VQTYLPVRMKVIITINFCCDKLWISKFLALGKAGKTWGFFLSYFCGHPGSWLVAVQFIIVHCMR